MGNIKISFGLSLISLLGFSLTGCSQSNKLTVAFTKITSIEKGAKVYTNDSLIGNVTDIRSNRTVDTIFVILEISRKIKVPKGSQFYLDEGLISSSKITIEYSNNNSYLNSNDLSMGLSRPISKGRIISGDSLARLIPTHLQAADTSKNR